MAGQVTWNLPAASSAVDPEGPAADIQSAPEATDASSAPLADAPFDPDQDRAEFEELLALITEHKDPDTVVRAMSTDEFMTGLTLPALVPATDDSEDNR